MDTSTQRRSARRIAFPRRWWTRAALIGAVLAAIAVPAAWASHQFADVPDSNPHHADISAIALAGVTTGCSPGLYCPGDAVTRQQMASFLRRGLGRAAYGALGQATVPTTETPAWDSFTISPGLPAGTVSGAAGFIKADTTITVELTDATGCPCQFRGALFVSGVGYMLDFYTDVTLATVGERKVLPMTGVVPVTTTGAKTVEVRLFRAAGSGAATAYGNGTATYFPFGSTGTNILGTASQNPSGANATGN
jgi:hypothetical protein